MSEELYIYLRTFFESLNFKYALGSYKTTPGYPYYVGEVTTETPGAEDGLITINFTLTGTNRSAKEILIKNSLALQKAVSPVGLKGKLANGNCFAIMYLGGQFVPTLSDEIERKEDYLTIKEWRAING